MMGKRSVVRGRRLAVIASSAVMLICGCLAPTAATAAGSADKGLRAYLDGKPLKLEDVGDWYCDDFSYPVIQCFTNSTELEIRDATVLSTSSIDYVTIYDFTTFAGSFMQVSQDYSVLATIGWNDRISSFKARNSQDGHFYTDWFYSGTGYYFCCNQQVTSLGAYDNTFSSVRND